MSDQNSDSTHSSVRQPSPEPTTFRSSKHTFNAAQLLGQSITQITSSGLFFMIVGALFLYWAYDTMGRAHSAMSFVFVVVGTAILLYGTGTQGMGELRSGDSAQQLARYNVALAGGAGVIAFAVAAGMIFYAPNMRNVFQVEQKYLRFYMKGDTERADDIGLYLPDVRVNGNAVPAVRRGDYIEIYAPYSLISGSARFEIRAKLHLPQKEGGLRQRAEGEFTVVLKPDGQIEDDGKPAGSYSVAGWSDFPHYTLRKRVELTEQTRLAGDAPR